MEIAHVILKIFGQNRILWVVWVVFGVLLFMLTVNTIANDSTIKTVACAESCRSPNERYEATRVGSHYEVRKTKSSKVIFTTHDKFQGSNDVKAGAFVIGPKVTTFRAAYHYSHNGPCTWIGTWDLGTGNLLGGEEKSGFIRDATSVLGKGQVCS